MRPSPFPRPLLPLVALAILGACSSSSQNPLLNPPPVAHQVTLTSFSDCASLDQAIVDTVVMQMKSQLEMIEAGYFYPVPLANGGPVPANAGNANGPAAYTTTTAQVAGVDEADFVQNDGTRIFVLSGDSLYAASSWPPQSLALQGQLTIEGWPREMFLSGNQVVVFSSLYVPRPFDVTNAQTTQRHSSPAPWPSARNGNAATAWTTPPKSPPSTSVRCPTPPSPPSFTSPVATSARASSAAKSGSSSMTRCPSRRAFSFGRTSPPTPPPTQRSQAFAKLEQANEALIRSIPLDDWLRRPSYKRPDGTVVQLGYSCTDFSRSNAPTKMGIVTIATLALNSQSLTSRTSVLEQADLVYASLSTLYIAAQHWWWWPAPGQDDATYVHAFDITQPNSVSYLGSGVVNGTPQNQYSFDEWNGNLRVATQLANRVADPANGPWGQVVNASQVSVLTLQGGTLVNTGTSVPVAQGDTLFASRFMGSRGFLVASRQVDPLITFDLTDPTNPTKVAELQVSGFSSFLYPIDDTHLLAVGEFTTGDDVSSQLQLTLFDVANLSAPAVVSQVLVGQGWASSQALWDPKALTWFPEKKLLALPFVDWQPSADWSGFISDLRLFTVDTTAGITPAGSLSMADVYESTGNQSWSYYWSPLVTRSILADNAVYAISNAGIRSALVPDLPSWLATVRFTPLLPPSP